MGKFSKDKGGNHEREICRKLSLWISRGERGDLFIRNVLSGGLHTRSREGTAGDVAASHPLSHNFLQFIHVECKHWDNLQVDAILWKDQGKLLQVIRTLERSCQREQQIYLLVARQNFKPDLVFLPYAAGVACCYEGQFHHVLWNGRVYSTRLVDLVKSDPDVFISRARELVTSQPRVRVRRRLETKAENELGI